MSKGSKKKTKTVSESVSADSKIEPTPLPGLPELVGPNSVAKDVVEQAKPPEPKTEVTPIVRKKADDGDDPNLMMTFKRWFALQGKPPHHKKGMQAFTSTKGKRSIAAWNRAFKAY